MPATDLATALRRAIDAAPPGTKVATMHLFGIDHADELHGVNLKELVVAAGETESWATEVGKGVKLATYVRRR